MEVSAFYLCQIYIRDGKNLTVIPSNFSGGFSLRTRLGLVDRPFFVGSTPTRGHQHQQGSPSLGKRDLVPLGQRGGGRGWRWRWRRGWASRARAVQGLEAHALAPG